MNSDTDAKPKRIRLRPEVRREQILDATLKEFSAHGYAATSLETIARRAGLSKAGLYAHFTGKEQLFEALLMKVLVPAYIGMNPAGSQDESLAHIIDVYIENIYGRLEDPTYIAVARLVIAEGGRAPHLIARWRNEVLTPYLEQQQQSINTCVQRGIARPSVLTANYSLILAPAVFASLWRFISDESSSRHDLPALKEAHRQFLLEALKPT